MLGNIEPMECIADAPFVEDLKSLGRVKSKLSYLMSNELEQILDQYTLTLPVQYLLSSGVNSKVPFYSLFTKDLIKITNKDSPTCYCWNEQRALWKEEKTCWIEKVYLKQYIERIYLTYYSILETLDDKHDTNKQDDSVICSFSQLLQCLLKLKDISISNSKIHEIIGLYISEIVDPDFSKALDPVGFIAVKGKEVVNLRTGEVKAREKTDYFTREVDVRYDPTAESQLLDQTIQQILLFDKEKINFLQEILGYSMSGDCREGKMLMLIGETRAGKSIIINLLESVLGEYSSFLNKAIIIDSNKSSDAPDPFLAELKGLRVGIINELKQVDVINTSKFKTLATNEKYTFRQLNSNLIEKVKSKHVLMIASNHKPIFPETDQSIWERLWIIKCEAKFVDNPRDRNEFIIDRTLRNKLDKQAFLKWLVDGAIRFFRNCEIKIPQSSLDALDEYKSASQDENELYFSQRIEATNNEKDRIQISVLFTDYKGWCRENNVKKHFTQTAFSETMARKGYEKKKNSNYYFTKIKYRDQVMNI